MNQARIVVAAAVVAVAATPGPPSGLARAESPTIVIQAASGQPTRSPESLDRLLAPVALYPDQLLAQMFVCAADPAQVAKLDTWLKQMTGVKATALQEAAQKAGFDPSFVALALIPQVVEMMAADLTWTADLGQAFKVARDGVFASIQRLRKQSQEVGNLKSTPQQTVETKTTKGGEQVIVIEPANPQVVYVPTYNAQTVYTTAPTSTVVVQQESSTGAAVAGAAIGFAAGIAIGAAIDNDYYYGPYGWRGGAYMYNDAWDDWYDDREDAREDWYDNREDAREDWQDHREDMAGERGERSQNAQQQRTDAQQARTQNAPQTQAERDQRRTDAQANAQQARGSGGSTYESRGKRSGESKTTLADRSGTKSDAFSNYQSGKSERSASSRGQRSRSSSGGGRSRRR